MLWDYNDKSAPVTSGYKLLDIIMPKTPWTEFHVFNQGGHYTFRENPESFNRVVRSWILDVESRP
jgi:pimeloyl-ACP methyl ester carboxylesterase